MALQDVGGLLHAFGGHEVRERLGEVAPPREGPSIAQVERPRSLGPPRAAELAAQEVEEQRIVDVVRSAALQGGNEQVPVDQPREKGPHVETVQHLRADFRLDRGGRTGAQQEVAHLHGLGGEDRFAEVVEDLGFGAREQGLRQIGGAHLQTRGLPQQLQGGDPAARARVEPFDRLLPRRQAEGVAEQRAGLLGCEQKIVPLDQRRPVLPQRRIGTEIGERAAGQDQVEGLGQAGHEPPQDPHARLGCLEVLHSVEHQHDSPAERHLGVADEDVGQALGFLRPETETFPETLAAPAELGDVPDHALDEVAEEDRGVAIRPVERVPDRGLRGLLEEARQKRRLAVSRTGEDERDALRKTCAQPVHEPRTPQVQSTDRGRQEPGDERCRGVNHGCASSVPSSDHSASPA